MKRVLFTIIIGFAAFAKETLLINILLFGIVWSSVAQQNTPTIFRHAGHLRYEGFSNNIENQELSLILDENSFSQYRLARRENIAAIPLWALSGVGLAAASTFVGFGIDADLYHYDPDSPVTSPEPFLYAAAGILFGATLLPFIPALVLTLDSHAKLNRIAKDYNQRKVSLTPSASPSGIGFTLKF